MVKSVQFGLACLLLAGVFLFSGCRSMESYKKERQVKAVEHFERAQWSRFNERHVFTLNECIDLALDYNLDIRVAKLEEKVASEQMIAEAFGMLPELTATNTTTNRNNDAASSSEALVEGGSTHSYSTSQDKFQNYLNVDLALSFIDFGLAACNTVQADDRTLIRSQRIRRTAQNLQMDVVRVYFQVAAAQRAISVTNDLLAKCQSRYALIAEMAQKRLISPFRAFDETRRFIEMEKRLTNYTRSYENSRSELCSLLGLSASTEIVVDTSMLNVDQPPVFSLPDIQVMEQIALMNRPELFEIDMQRHINVLELYKTIISMFPNVRIYMDFTNSSNSFLYHASWMELGIRAAYNLLKLPQHIMRAKSYYTQIQTEEQRGFSQAVGILSQVRISEANMRSTLDRFLLDNKIYNVYNMNLQNAEASLKASGGLSKLELDHIRLSTAEVQIERLMSLGNYYVSYFRIINSMGIDRKVLTANDDFVKSMQSAFKEAKAEAEEKVREAWLNARKEGWENLPVQPPCFVEQHKHDENLENSGSPSKPADSSVKSPSNSGNDSQLKQADGKKNAVSDPSKKENKTVSESKNDTGKNNTLPKPDSKADGKADNKTDNKDSNKKPSAKDEAAKPTSGKETESLMRLPVKSKTTFPFSLNVAPAPDQSR